MNGLAGNGGKCLQIEPLPAYSIPVWKRTVLGARGCDAADGGDSSSARQRLERIAFGGAVFWTFELFSDH